MTQTSYSSLIRLIRLIMRRGFKWGQLDLYSVPRSKVIAFIQNRFFRKVEMFVSGIRNQICHYMKIAGGAWNFFHIVFGTSLTTYKRNKFQKRSTWSPTWLNRYSFETRAPAPFLYVLEAMKTPIFMFFWPCMSYLILSYVSNNAGNEIL